MCEYWIASFGLCLFGPFCSYKVAVPWHRHWKVVQFVLEPLELRVFQNAQNSLCSGNPKWLLNLLVSSCSSCFMASLGDGRLKGVSESVWNFWSLLSGFFGIPTSAHDTTVDIDWHARFDFDISWLTLCIFISSNLHIFFTYFSHLPIFNQLPSSSQRCIGIVVCYSWHHLAFIPSSIHLRNRSLKTAYILQQGPVSKPRHRAASPSKCGLHNIQKIQNEG